MTDFHGEHVPPDLHEVAERLRRDRPQLSALELDQVKLRARSQAARRAPGFLSRQKGFLMKSRLALTSVLVIGLLMSFTGAGLAVSGVASSGSSAGAQYNAPAGGQKGQVLATQQQPTPPAPTQVQAVRQVSAPSSGSLPFTGYLAIPLLVVGVAMLGTGLVIRRKSRGSEA
ncbi:MAG: hypothetical protein IRZ21_08925 [Thermoleophilaceae bacterium]|nr:hypothetical protein [Thermoleophilaceae bacterium]